MERTNLRYVTKEQIPEDLDLAVMDVSFISIRLVLPAVKELLKPGADYICLIKPQFEAGREEVGKKGVVRDPAVHEEVVRGILDFAPSIGFTVMGLDFSPIRGPEGNIEYICWLKNGEFEGTVVDPAAVVKASHEAF
jgi:23S rRNA (cytidine1920-2'-O)/16S rRNA (cytidine1409-2'-O)-methyltransferase